MSCLKDYLFKNRIKQTELAKKLGVSDSAITYMTKTGIHDIRIAKKYASILECDPIFLLEK